MEREKAKRKREMLINVLTLWERGEEASIRSVEKKIRGRQKEDKK